MERNMIIKNDIKFHPLNAKEEIDESILEHFRFAEGRRFHNVKDAPYFLANDDEEVSRLQTAYCIYKHLWQKIYSSPIHERLLSGKLRVLDSGCGPGTWILDMANSYKKSSFVGVDLSPSMFPSARNEIIPDNVLFLERNIIDGFPFPNETFDFVHQAFMALSFTEKQWQEVILDTIRITKPGGWIEFVETDMETYFGGPLTKKFSKSFHDLLNSRGINPFIATRIKEYLQSINKVTNIHVESKATPLGTSRIGELLSRNGWSALSHAKSHICKFMGIPIEEYENFVEKIRKEYGVNKSFIKSYRIYARKL